MGRMREGDSGNGECIQKDSGLFTLHQAKSNPGIELKTMTMGFQTGTTR